MIRSALVITLSTIALLPLAHGATDWRLDLLRSKGIATTHDSLKKVATKTGVDHESMNQAFQQLGSAVFQEREKAHAQLKSLGSPALAFLNSKKPINNPEVRVRVEQIQQHLESNVTSVESLIVITAAKSLLKSPDDKSTGGQFFEWFGTESDDCRKGYRQWVYEGPKEVAPLVQKSQLVIPGKFPGAADQRMILRSSAWPATKELPKHFSVSCLVGGTRDRNSVWHLGITIGKVKTLIHPGYRGGGFRFEQVSTFHKFTQNISMGYTPATNQLHRMKVVVTQLDNGKVRLSATVTSPGNKPFEKSVVVRQEDIGPLNQISLDRSGNLGGNAYFDDFRIQLEP